MRRYTLGVRGREFVIDVQELSADRFEVLVGDESYEVSLSGDEDVPDAVITPGYQPGGTKPGAVHAPVVTAAAGIRPRAAPPAAASPGPASRPGPKPGGGVALNAPMPGVILELHVKVGDVVQRGQHVAVLDAMKMHNFIGAPRTGTISEVCVAVGQAVGHGDTIVRFTEG
jgi:biotin carboxyl carrier protein